MVSDKMTVSEAIEWLKQKRELLSIRMAIGRFHAQDAKDMTAMSVLMEHLLMTDEHMTQSNQHNLYRGFIVGVGVGIWFCMMIASMFF